jgi:hypothetical protein
VYTLGVSEILSTGDCAEAADCFLTFQLLDQHSEKISSNFLFLDSLSHTTLQDPTLTVTEVKQISQYKVRVTLQTSLPAIFVWLETPLSGQWYDNGFLMTESTKHIAFQSYNPIDASQFASTLSVSSLYDVYAS